jgi:P4 family phage/plasmid primase-like protien
VRIGDPDRKYIWLVGSTALAHVPNGTPRNCPIVRVTEGPLKADVAWYLDPDRIPTIGVPGVSTWKGAMPVLKALGAQTVRLAYDADQTRNQGVSNALASFGRALLRAGYRVELETWDEADGKGIDDLLKGGKKPEVKPFRVPDRPEVKGTSQAGHTITEPDDPGRLARLFLENHTWRYWKDSFWDYTGTHYREVSGHEAGALLWAHVEAEFKRDHAADMVAYRERCREIDRYNHGRRDGEQPRRYPPRLSVRKVSGGLVKNVREALASLTLVPDRVPQPSLLPAGEETDLLALRNGLLDPRTRELRPHTPDYFSTVCLPYEYDPAAEPPVKFLAMLKRVLGDDELAGLMQEWFGYHLIRSTDAQRFMLFTGEGGNGKGTVCATLEAMLGRDNVSSVSLSDIGKEYGLHLTHGKLANISADVSELGETNEGTLRMLTSGDKMTFNQKFKPLYNARPTARLTFCCNDVPRFSDRSEGLPRRMLFVPFRVQITEEERVAGMDKPDFWERSGELPGILNWALEGLNRLLKRGMRFVEPKVCQVAKEEHRQISNPVRRFLKEHFEYDPEAPPLSSERLYQSYKVWARNHGYDHPLSEPKLVKEVERLFPKATKERHSFKGDGRKMAWFGLRRLQALPDTYPND